MDPFEELAKLNQLIQEHATNAAAPASDAGAALDLQPHLQQLDGTLQGARDRFSALFARIEANRQKNEAAAAARAAARVAVPPSAAVENDYDLLVRFHKEHGLADGPLRLLVQSLLPKVVQPPAPRRDPLSTREAWQDWADFSD